MTKIIYILLLVADVSYGLLNDPNDWTDKSKRFEGYFTDRTNLNEAVLDEIENEAIFTNYQDTNGCVLESVALNNLPVTYNSDNFKRLECYENNAFEDSVGLQFNTVNTEDTGNFGPNWDKNSIFPNTADWVHECSGLCLDYNTKTGTNKRCYSVTRHEVDGTGFKCRLHKCTPVSSIALNAFGEGWASQPVDKYMFMTADLNKGKWPPEVDERTAWIVGGCGIANLIPDPTSYPTKSPTSSPTTPLPTRSPTLFPTMSPTGPTVPSTPTPTLSPITSMPTLSPTNHPVSPTNYPTSFTLYPTIEDSQNGCVFEYYDNFRNVKCKDSNGNVVDLNPDTRYTHDGLSWRTECSRECARYNRDKGSNQPPCVGFSKDHTSSDTNKFRCRLNPCNAYDFRGYEYANTASSSRNTALIKEVLDCTAMNTEPPTPIQPTTQSPTPQSPTPSSPKVSSKVDDEIIAIIAIVVSTACLIIVILAVEYCRPTKPRILESDEQSLLSSRFVMKGKRNQI